MPIAEDFKSLCRYFDDEVERQENVLALTRAQGMAARVYDLEGLEAKTGALNLLIQEAVDAEPERLRLVRELVEACALPPEQRTLSGLIASAPEPWRGRLRESQTRLREVLRDSRAAAAENRVLLRRGLHAVNAALSSLVHCVAAAESAYTAQGVEATARAIGAGLIDARG